LILTDLEQVVPLMQERLEVARRSSRKGRGREGRLGKEEEEEEEEEGLRCDVAVKGLAWGDVGGVERLGRELGLAIESGSSCGSSEEEEGEGERKRRERKEDLRLLTHILISDCIYFPPLHPLLLTTLLALTSPSDPPSSLLSSTEPSSSSPLLSHSSPPLPSHPPPELMIAYKTRSYTLETPFWHALSEHFSIEPVISNLTGLRLGAADTEGGGEMGVVIARRREGKTKEEEVGWEELVLLGAVGEGVFD
jgi:hypothetical protein